MNVYNMEGFLRGKCLPGDLKVNESNAEYLVRKLNAVSELKGELTAALATIEKCREIVGCPAGVDLQDHLRQLAAENVGLKKFIQTECFVGHIDPETFYEEEVTRYVNADGYEPETPATDRIYAGIKADGVEEFAAYCGEENSVFVEAKAYYRSLPDAAYEFSSMLREGAK
ncbi:Uncharacterised protein [Raoultella terrigena]|uniref:hypothetical protein n=1 Tax=Raoultella terrigena TaxID=577 RepID=UPI0011629C26|nr:hypothetical protein [Raoultella terrigena]VUC85048.1 Uncharacterised protein [Raoultella terrigena]